MASTTPTYTRADERSLEAYALRISAGEMLTQDETAELRRLKRKQEAFVKASQEYLVENAPSEEESPDTAAQLSDVLTHFGKATYFWGSLLATALPGYVGQKTGLTHNFKHWNYITDHLILGALPVLTSVGSNGNHLLQLKQQLDDRHQVLGLIVACLEAEEMDGFGVSLIEFAKKESWASINPNIKYTQVSMTDTRADTSLDSVAAAVAEMQSTIEAGEVVYVHCKAGKGRSWMVVMCYLTTRLGMDFAAAERLVSGQRPQVNPSEEQRQFVRHFMRTYGGSSPSSAPITISL